MAKTTAKKSKNNKKPTTPKKNIHANVDAAHRSMRISILLFIFVLMLTIGVLMYQYQVKPSGKELLTSTLNASSVDFTDITEEDKKNNDFMAALKYLLTKKVISGYSDNTLKVGNPVNRAEFIKMLSVSLGANVESFAEPCFTDITGTEWYAKFVCYAKDAGWVGGATGGKFLPGNQISLAEAIKIVVTAQGWESTDTDEIALPKSKKIVQNAWYVPYLKVAFSKSLLDFEKNENLDPGKLLTRKDVIFIIFKASLIDTLKVKKYSPSLITELYKQAGIVMSAEATPAFKSAPVTAEAAVTTKAKPKK